MTDYKQLPASGSSLQYEPPKTHCWGRLTRTVWYIVCTSICLMVTLLVVLLVIFVGGRALADQEIQAAAITMKLTISDPKTSSFHAHCEGTIDNRGTFTATLQKTTVHMKYKSKTFASLSFPSLTIDGGTITPFTIDGTVHVSKISVFDEFAADLMAAQSLDVSLSSSVTATAYGISMRDISFDKKINLIGFNSFRNPAPAITSIDVNEGLSDRIRINIGASLYNPSSMAMKNIGPVNFTIIYQNVVMGWAVSTDEEVSLNFGDNLLNFTGWVIRTDDNNDEISEILGLYMTGQDTLLELHGSERTTPYPLLNGALRSFSATGTLPGLSHMEDKLFQTVYALFDTDQILMQIDPVNCSFAPPSYLYQDVFIYAYNPMNVSVVLNGADFNVTWMGAPGFQGGLFGEGRGHDLNFLLPPLQSAIYKQRVCLTGTISLVFEFVTFLGQQPSSVKFDGQPFQVVMSVDGVAVGNAGGFLNATIPYFQNSIMAVGQLKNDAGLPGFQPPRDQTVEVEV